MPTRSTLGRFLATPENRAALLAIQDVLAALTSDDEAPNPLFLHGPAGVGKTLVIDSLLREVADLGRTAIKTTAQDFAAEKDWSETREADVWIVEDLQHLPTRFAETLVRLIDEGLRRGQQLIFSANVGPGRLRHRGNTIPPRLTSRLASGLVVAIEPMQAASRKRALKTLAEETDLTLSADVLDWLAKHLTGGGRQLEGAIRQLKSLQRLHKKPLTLAEVQGHFRVQVEAKAPTVKRIAEHVGDYFRIPTRHLISARRSREVVLPRQISMYLARQLTGLSLEKIGKYFGGRDHKTVQHACRKVEAAMKRDAVLSGTVRQMHAELA